MGGRCSEGCITDPRNKRMGTAVNREEWRNFLGGDQGPEEAVAP